MSNLSAALPASIASKETTSALATIGDAALDAAISSGALDGVPILGAATGIWRAHKEVGQQLFMRKVVRFLRETNQTADQDRIDFVDRLKADGKTEEFGEAILLILDRLDDTVKPGILGRLVAAHIRGDLDYDKMMRLTSIVSRCSVMPKISNCCVTSAMAFSARRRRSPKACSRQASCPTGAWMAGIFRTRFRAESSSILMSMATCSSVSGFRPKSENPAESARSRFFHFFSANFLRSKYQRFSEYSLLW